MTLLLVCSGGGHLKGLHQIADRLPTAQEGRTWVTFDTGLSRSMLADEDVVFAPYAAPRDVVNIARNQWLATRMIASRRWSAVISTGSSIAVNFLPLAAARGIPAHFVESAARMTDLSMTGRILARVPGVRCHVQSRALATRRWHYAGSEFDAFERDDDAAPAPAPIQRAVVSVGTTESYGFRRLLDAAAPLLVGVDTVWQTGATDARGLGIDARPTVPFTEMAAAVAEADVVVAHAGTGTALTALEAGRCPVLVPRLGRYDEHVDDHQEQIAAELSRRGLAITCSPEDLTEATLHEAARRRVRRNGAPPPMVLS